MVGVFIAPVDDNLSKMISAMDKHTREWEMRAARGECSWVCADCCCTFAEGMPDACTHGIQACTDIIKRDKANALLPDNAEISARRCDGLPC